MRSPLAEWDLQLISKVRGFSLTLSTQGRRTTPMCTHTFKLIFEVAQWLSAPQSALAKLRAEMRDPAASGLLKFLVPLSASFSGCVTFHLFRYFHVAKKKKKVNTHVMHLVIYYNSAVNSELKIIKKAPTLKANSLIFSNC